MNIAFFSRAVKTGVLTFAAAALLLAPAAVHAESVAVEGTAAIDAASITDEQLQTFAVLQSQMQAVAEKYQGNLQDGADAVESQRAQAEMNEEMNDLIRESGLSAEEFNRIAHALRTDEALRNKLNNLN